MTKSPIMSLYSQCLFGLTSIRAFKAEKYLLDQMEHHIDTSGKVFVTWMICGRCFGARLDLIGVTIMVNLIQIVKESHCSYIVQFFDADLTKKGSKSSHNVICYF